MKGVFRAVYFRYGGMRLYADRRHLMALMPGYKEEPFLLDEIEVIVGVDGNISEVKAIYRYQPSRSGYFEGHMDGLFPGFGGHSEFMAQTSAGGSVLSGRANSKIVLLGADSIRTPNPVRGSKDLTCIAKPVAHTEVDKAFQCEVYSAKEYRRVGANARLLSQAIILGKSVA